MRVVATLIVLVLVAMPLSGCGGKSQSEKMHEKLAKFQRDVHAFQCTIESDPTCPNWSGP